MLFSDKLETLIAYNNTINFQKSTEATCTRMMRVKRKEKYTKLITILYTIRFKVGYRTDNCAVSLTENRLLKQEHCKPNQAVPWKLHNLNTFLLQDRISLP